MRLHRAFEERMAPRAAEPLVLANGEFTWLLGSLCQFHRVPFDAALVEQQIPPPRSDLILRAPVAALGFNLRPSTRTHTRLDLLVMLVVGCVTRT